MCWSPAGSARSRGGPSTRHPGSPSTWSRVPDELRAALAGPGLLAAHAAVLAALSGEADVTAGYVAAPGGRPLPVRLDTEAGSWRELVDRAGRGRGRAVGAPGLPGAEPAAGAGRARAALRDRFDPTGTADGTGDDAAAVGVTPTATALRLRYRTEVLDGEAAARIAGYHLPRWRCGRRPGRRPAGGPACCRRGELRFQIEGLAGPARELPDRRFHELFEDAGAGPPGAVAAVQAGGRGPTGS